MNRNRRDFLKSAALGSIAITSGGSFSVLNADAIVIAENVANASDPKGFTKPWDVFWDDASDELTLTKGPISIMGELSFYSDDKKWSISSARDGVLNRYALIDTEGNVQGYLVINSDGGQAQLLFYHRTAQAFEGELTFKGKVNFMCDSFACRTIASQDERVLSLSCGLAESLLNDSLFSPENDTVLQFIGSQVSLGNTGSAVYGFHLKGVIHQSSEAVFSISCIENYYKNRYVPYYQPLNRARCATAPTGWMSWNTYFDKATAEDNLAEAKIGQKYLQPFGCEFWSIESWQGNSDQLPVRDFYNMDLEINEGQFPKGMKQLANDIRKLGFKPGIWMAPFGTGNESFYKAHQQWFLHDKEGVPISSWNGRYTLDPTVKEARNHLRDIFRKAHEEWGYVFFKVDGMSGRNHGYCAHLYERPEIRDCFYDPSCPNSFELCVQSFREGMGEDCIFLACQGHSSGPEAKYADASRIGADIVHPNQPVQWSNVLNQARCTINQTFTHNIVMVNDPDTLLVADLPIEEARVSTTVVALPGQLTFFGDKLGDLPADRMKLLQQTLPVGDIRPSSLYPYFSMLPIWNLSVHNEILGEYNIVALFNWEDEQKEISFTTEELGIDSTTERFSFEFWTEEYMGEFKEAFSMVVPPHSVKLLALHPVKQIPQWMSSDRHLTQNAIELKKFDWDDQAKTIAGEIELIGTFPLTMRIRIPANYSYKSIKCRNVELSVSVEDNMVLAIVFNAKRDGVYPFTVQF